MADISKININGTVYNIKDIIARAVSGSGGGGGGGNSLGITSAIDLGIDRTGSTPASDTINAFLSGGSKCLYFPEGLYYIDKQINLASDTYIEAAPGAVFYDPNYRTTSKHRFFYSKDARNVHFRGGLIAGNNSNFAYETDGFAELSDGFDQGCGLYFQNVVFGTVRDTKTCYLNESMVFKWCIDCNIDNIRIDQGADGGTQTGITIAGGENTHMSNIRCMNGGDGALYIYNGFNNSIKNSVIINQGSHWNANCGMETCDHCVIDNVVVQGGAMGFPVVESARDCVVSNCIAIDCVLGFIAGPFGIGTPGEDIKFIGCSVINHHAGNESITLPHAGFCLCYYNVWGANSNRMSNGIQISNCYFGKSNAGHALHILANGNVDLSRVVISNNIFEGRMYQYASQTNFNSADKLVVIEGGDGAIISDNVFVLPSNGQSSQIDIQNSTNIKFLNNTIITEAANNQISLDGGCSNCVIGGNSFTNCAGGKSAITLAGTGNVIRDNDFTGSGTIVTVNNANNYVMNNVARNCGSASTFCTSAPTVKVNNYGSNGTSL